MAPYSKSQILYADWPSDLRKSCFPFLELPAEIRNRIYDFAVEEPLDEACFARHLVKNPSNAIASPTNESSDPASRRLFHGLTQTCSAVRQEFRPIYIQANEVCVYACDSAEYAEMMIGTKAHSSSDQAVVANLCVDVVTPRELATPGWCCESDVLAILKICCMYSTVLARFTIFLREGISYMPRHFSKLRIQLQQLFSMVISEWKEVVTQDLSHVHLRIESNITDKLSDVYLVFRPGIQCSKEIDSLPAAIGGTATISSATMSMERMTQNLEEIKPNLLGFLLCGFTNDRNYILGFYQSLR